MTAGSDRAQAATAIIRVCRRLYERGLIAGPDGNVSVRLADGSVLATPTGMSKVDVEVDDLVTVGLSGTVISGARAPSSELRMHLGIYRCRVDVRAVVHAHPPTATGFAVAGESFVAPVLPEVILQMGAVPLVGYDTPGTDALADRCASVAREGHVAFLMANHGATTTGETLDMALQRMESLEHAARIILAARLLGRVNELSTSEVQALRASREDER